jgi:oxaloacetate decarboxylase (Na+ extruding) subunit gamma
MDTNLVMEGFKFMALGMGTVFIFLAVLIVLMNVMSVVLHKLFPEPQHSGESGAKTDSKSNKVIAAITAAITHHRQG